MEWGLTVVERQVEIKADTVWGLCAGGSFSVGEAVSCFHTRKKKSWFCTLTSLQCNEKLPVSSGMSLKSWRYNLLDLPHSSLRTQANTELLHDPAIKRVNNGVPASESSRRTTLRMTSKQSQIHTRTQGGLTDLLSSPPVVCSGVWLSPRPPFKGSAVVWTNKAVAQDHAITTDPVRIFLLALKEMFPWLCPVSLANVFYLNSPAGHTTWYVGRTHSRCTRMHIEHSGPKVTWPPGMWTVHLLAGLTI